MEPKTRQSKKGLTNAESEAFFYEESIAEFGNVFSFGSRGIKFVNWAKPIGITCKICATTWVNKSPTEHMGRGCLICKREKARNEKTPKARTAKQKALDVRKHEKNIQNFMKNAPGKQDYRYDYNDGHFKYEMRQHASGVWRGYVTVYCRTHNYEFSHWADDHLNGKSSCDSCTRDAKRVAMAKSWEQFIIDAKAIKEHDGKYEYPSVDVEYINAKSKITIYCKICGENFIKIADDHLSNIQGCTICSPKSQGEETVRRFLIDRNIAFKKEFSFPGSRKLYDFLLTEYNIFIEYDGKQHFNFTKFWHKTEDGFAAERANDVEKTVKAIQAGYQIIRIDYLIAKYDDIANAIIIAIEQRNEYDMFVSSHLYDTMVNSVKLLIGTYNTIVMMNEFDAYDDEDIGAGLITLCDDDANVHCEDIELFDII